VEINERILGGTSIGGSLSPIELGPGRPHPGRRNGALLDFTLTGMLEQLFEANRLMEAQAGG
jgi:hypothetical protein